MELRDVSRLPIVPRTEPGGFVSRTASLLCWLAFHSRGNQMLHSARPNAGAEDTGHGLDRAIGDRHLDVCPSHLKYACFWRDGLLGRSGQGFSNAIPSC